MYSKEQIFNLALNALLLQRRITDTTSDKSNENLVLNNNWDVALSTTITDLNLDGFSEEQALELIAADPNDEWQYVYKYPTNCARFRRIRSGMRMDSRDTHIEKKVAIYNGSKAIFTDEPNAIAEIIPNDIALSNLSAEAVQALAFRLALLAAPLVTGKGSKALLDSISNKYKIAKAEAQALDADENFVFTDADVESEFVAARID